MLMTELAAYQAVCSS